MAWIRLTRITPEAPSEHEPILLNTAHIISVEQVENTVYVHLRDGRHFAVAEALETLRTELMPPGA